MSITFAALKSGNKLSAQSLLIWRLAQSSVWLIGAAILFALLFMPSTGLLLFWNILIPVAPALFVVLVGVWRNVCPLATTNLLPRHLGLSKQKKLTASQLGILNLIAVITLYTIVPLRHAVFNHNGLATALLIITMVFTGMVMGFFFEWKSAWCSGLCPVHPVEKLYGGNVLMSMPNAHCDQCRNCVIPCPDSTPNITPASAKKTFAQQLSGLLIIGGLPGFIWGWFQVPDQLSSSVNGLIGAYEMPLLGFAVSFMLYAALSSLLDSKFERRLIAIFAASGVSCYYWFRIPALFGFGSFADDGLLIDLRSVLPAWNMTAITIVTTIFFFYWLVIRKQNHRSWVIRPAFADKQKLTA
jgi:hypothetical protein